MGNPRRGFVKVGTYTLRLGINEICEFEAGLPKGETLFSFFGGLAENAEGGAPRGNLKIADMRRLVHCAMRGAHPEATLAEAGDLISDEGVGFLGELARGTFGGPPAEDGEAGGDPMKPHGTGSDS